IADDGSHGVDANAQNNSFTLTTPVCPTPDLAITKSLQAGKTCVAPGDTLVYTLTASTLTNVAVTGVLIKDTLPANTVFIAASDNGVFANGAVTFPTFPMAGNSSVTRTVTLQAANPLPQGANNFVNTVTI